MERTERRVERRARLSRLCLLLLDREHSRVHRQAPAILPHDFLCDGPWIDDAQARKTEQDYEAGDQHPAAHPLRWLLRTRCERPSERRAAEKSDEFAPPHIQPPGLGRRHRNGED